MTLDDCDMALVQPCGLKCDRALHCRMTIRMIHDLIEVIAAPTAVLER